MHMMNDGAFTMYRCEMRPARILHVFHIPTARWISWPRWQLGS